jgi:hypothetical protein
MIVRIGFTFRLLHCKFTLHSPLVIVYLTLTPARYTHTHHFLAFFNGIAIAEVTTAFPYQQPSDEKKIWCGFDFKNGAVLIPRGREIPWC